MNETVRDYQPFAGIKAIAGLSASLVGLSQDGYKNTPLGELYKELAAPNPDFIAAHPNIQPLLHRAEVLTALSEFIQQNRHDLLVPSLVQQLLETDTYPIIAEPLQIKTGFQNSVMLGGEKGLLQLLSERGVEKLEVIDVENSAIADVVLPPETKKNWTVEELEKDNTIYQLSIKGLQPGKTQVLVRAITNTRTYSVLVPVEVSSDSNQIEVEKHRTLFNAFSKYTTLPEHEQLEIAQAVPRGKVRALINHIKALWQHEAESCFDFTADIDMSPYYQNLILLNIPNLGPRLARQAVSHAVYRAMDKRDFEGNVDRMQKYGVYDSPIVETGFPLASAWDANRNVAQATSKYLSVGHVAQLVGVDVQTMLHSEDSDLVEIRSMLSDLPGSKVAEYRLAEDPKIPEPATLQQQIFVDSVIARVLPDILTKTIGTRTAKISIPFGADVAQIDVAVRNAQGAFITHKKVATAAEAELMFTDLPFSEKLLITATATLKTGKKRLHQTTVLPANTAAGLTYGIGMQTWD